MSKKIKIAPNALEGAYAFGANSHDADVLSDLINRESRQQQQAVYISADDLPVLALFDCLRW